MEPQLLSLTVQLAWNTSGTRGLTVISFPSVPATLVWQGVLNVRGAFPGDTWYAFVGGNVYYNPLDFNAVPTTTLPTLPGTSFPVGSWTDGNVWGPIAVDERLTLTIVGILDADHYDNRNLAFTWQGSSIHQQDSQPREQWPTNR